MRFATLILTACLLAACGGGGGGPPSDGGGEPPPGGDATTKAILEDCLVPGALQEIDGWGDLAQAVVGGNGSGAGISILPGGVLVVEEMDNSSLEIACNHDPDATRDDGMLILRFLQASGEPVQPFSPADRDSLVMSEDIDVLGAILPNVPAGTRLVFEYSGPLRTTRSGGLDVPYPAGSPGAADGGLALVVNECDVQLDWTDLAIAGLQGNLATTFPAGTFQVSIAASGHMVIGTWTMDGTSTSTLQVALDGGATTGWSLDLVTGVATAQ